MEPICALATAPGGAIGIIRISGDQSLEILSRIFSKNLTAAQPNTIHYGHLIDKESNPIDEVLVSVFRTPHSYTGEDCVEISCHGSRYILQSVLDLLCQQGCRMAGPGEFTMRAYLNGKMDLSQAEAVADLIASSNKTTHQMAMSQLRGHFSSELSQLRDKLLKLTSLLELELDFSDHEDLEFADRSELLQIAQDTDAHITHLAQTFEAGNALKNGIPVAIVGAPNVGKSTLLNALVGEERAIVSDIQGTTRDSIEDTIQLGGITFRFIDTAGIRHTDDQIEQMGIERTFAAIAKATIVLWLLDKAPTPSNLADMQQRCQGKTLIFVQNKADLNVKTAESSLFPQDSSLIKISAKYGAGLEQLRQQLIDAAPATTDSDVIVNNARHYEALCRAHTHLLRVIEGLGAKMVNGHWETVDSILSGDLLSEDLRLTLDTLAEITGGQITPNEVLGNIFKHFCVGK